MNGLEEIREGIKNFIYEKKQVQKQIKEIEEKRTQLAQERNEKKKSGSENAEIIELGKQIHELGNQSQELQNKLDFRFCEAKAQINFSIDNFIAEGIRKIRITNEEIRELQEKNEKQKEREEKYELQKQEFYARFGRMPELSENAIKEKKVQEKEATKNLERIEELNTQLTHIQDEITELAKVKRDFKNGNWNFIVEDEETVEEIYVETLVIEEMQPIEEITVEEFEGIEELHIEPFEAIEAVQELNVEEISETNEEEKSFEFNRIEEIAKAIVEEIIAQQTKDYNVVENFEQDEVSEDIITFKEQEKKEDVIIPLFGQRIQISNIIIKFEENELVYKAQMSNDEEIKIYPSKLGEESVLLRDKQNRKECEEILIKYANSEYKEFDKKVISKIDPLVCELLIECSEKYSLNAQKLMYNYAMSYTYSEQYEENLVPEIIYNLSYIQQSDLTKKEQSVLNKICKHAGKNDKIHVIETISGFKRIKYLFKRLFAVNNVKVLPEAKY